MRAATARRLFSIHRWTGLASGLVILFLSVTGAGLVFVTELDRGLNRDLMVAGPSGRPLTPDEALERVGAEYPGLRINRIDLPRDATWTYTVWTRPQDGFNQVMVEPYTGEVLGTRDYQSSLAFVLRQLHLRFYAFGWKGRVVVGGFGLVLLVSVLTGLLIYGRFIRALPRWWAVRRGRGFQIVTSDWHKLVGILALAFNLVIAVTGAVLGLENLARYSTTVREAIHPAPDAAGFPDPPSTLEGTLPVAVALERARWAIPGFAPTYVLLPQPGRSHYRIYGNTEGAIAMEGATSAGVHALTGEVFYALDARAARPITKAYYWMDPLHFGYWGGVWSQLVYLVLGLTTAFLSITGFALWLAKRRRRARSHPRAAVPAILEA